MRFSKMMYKSSKNRLEAHEMLLSQRTLYKAGQLIRYGQGVYGENTILLKARQKVENIIRDVLEEFDCVEVEVPILQSRELWERSGRWEKYQASGQMLHCETDQGDFCLAPTAEEAMMAFVEKTCSSYKDLPVTLFQIGTKFRNEIRFHGGLMRSKEFLMMDAYSFSSTAEDMAKQYENVRKAYLEIFKRLGLDVIPVKALSGDMGGKFSEEFMCLSQYGEDNILYSEKHGIAFNEELLELENASEYLKENYGIEIELTDFQKMRAIELGHIFQLGTFYSEKMGVTFIDSNSNNAYYHMGCYGIGVGRTLSAILEKCIDNDGIVWPTEISPFTMEIVADDKHMDVAEELYSSLKSSGSSVILDDRNKLSLGTKLKDWKLLGFPDVIIIGNKVKTDAIGNRLYEVESRAIGLKVWLSLEELKKNL